MAVQFAQPYRFTGQQLARMQAFGVVPEQGTELIDGVPHWGGSPVRFSRAKYYRLGEIGVLEPHARVELVDGEIIAMSPAGHRHSACVSRTVRFLNARVGSCIVRSENPLALPEEYDPQPDVVVALPHPADYDGGHPTEAETLVAIEVADSSVRHDRHFKAGRYAAAGIPEYWIVDLTRDVIVVQRDPVAGVYLKVQTLRPGETWMSPALGGLEIAVRDLTVEP